MQHGKRADSIVKNMLLHSREGSGEHRPVDVNALFEEAVILPITARGRRSRVSISPWSAPLTRAAGEVDLFPQEITRVLLNLISNGFYAATKRKAAATDDDLRADADSRDDKDLGDRASRSGYATTAPVSRPR